MVKKREYSADKIQGFLSKVDENLEKGKPLSASRALTAALNYARFYEGADRNDYLKEIEQRALVLEEDRTLKDDEYEHVQGIEEFAVSLRTKESGIEGILPAILGGCVLIAGLFFLSSNFLLFFSVLCLLYST